MPKSDKPYAVGYGKPPKGSQFKKGHSGNPAGRPKGRRNLASVLEDALFAKVTVIENGRRTQRTKLEATFAQVVNKAANGDLRAMGVLLQLMPLLDQQSSETSSPDLAADRALAQKIAQRFAAMQLSSLETPAPQKADDEA